MFQLLGCVLWWVSGKTLGLWLLYSSYLSPPKYYLPPQCMTTQSVVLVASINSRYTISTLPVFRRFRWGLILGCTNEELLMWHRKCLQCWLLTVKIVMALVLALALLNPSGSYKNLSLIVSSLCGGIPSRINLLLIT